MGCRPECTSNYDCPSSKACFQNFCRDPCPGECGINALCTVSNHIPNCACFEGYTGNPRANCYEIVKDVDSKKNSKISLEILNKTKFSYLVPRNPCVPSPCGQFSQCRVVNGQSVCSCLPGYISMPPSCRPECFSSSDCSNDKSCIEGLL